MKTKLNLFCVCVLIALLLSTSTTVSIMFHSFTSAFKAGYESVEKVKHMHNWFECKVSYEKMLENGMKKKVTEPYWVDALSFTEAEARIIEEIRPFITGET